MEMVPMRVQAAPNQVVNFVCAYFSMERLEIDIQPIGHNHIDGKMLPISAEYSLSNTSLMLGQPVRDILDRFAWGSRRTLELRIDSGHRQVKCRVANTDGLVLGELTALIQPAGSLSIKNKNKTKIFIRAIQKMHKTKIQKRNRPTSKSSVANRQCRVRFSFHRIFFTVALTFHDTYLQTRMKQKFNFNHEIALPQCVACPVVNKIFLSVRGLIFLYSCQKSRLLNETIWRIGNR